MEKINIAELLKDCPKGMELDCTVYDNCILESVLEGELYPIKIQTPEGFTNLTKFGSFSPCTHSKCIIFPKGKTTWEGFVPLVKGDIIYTDGLVAILHNITESGTLWYYCYYSISENRCKIKTDFGIGNVKDNEFRHATEAEKQKLFQAIKENGYKWNPETKTLEKLVEPKFKVGDRIRHKTHIRQGNVVTEIKDTHYILDDELALPFISQNEYELVPNKFDINTLVPFEDKVLVRNDESQRWLPAFWGYKVVDGFITTFGWCKYCIPYKGNEILFKTNNDCDDFYKTWEK